MKTIIGILLVSAALFAFAPQASACEVSDPTGQTTTCVDQYEYTSGDCETYGYSYTGTSVYSNVPGVGAVGANNYENCYNDAFGSGESSGTNFWVNAQGVYVSGNSYSYNDAFGEGSGTGASASYEDNYVSAGTSESGSFCVVYAYGNTPAGGLGQSHPCPA